MIVTKFSSVSITPPTWLPLGDGFMDGDNISLKKIQTDTSKTGLTGTRGTPLNDGSSIPSTGSIRMSDFRNKKRRENKQYINMIIGGGTGNNDVHIYRTTQSLYRRFVFTEGWNSTIPLQVDITLMEWGIIGGLEINDSSGQAFPSGSSINLYVSPNSGIFGGPGAGGTGASAQAVASKGLNGGPAIRWNMSNPNSTCTLNIYNYGHVCGGGGGGGGGGHRKTGARLWVPGSGGGGGSGVLYGDIESSLSISGMPRLVRGGVPGQWIANISGNGTSEDLPVNPRNGTVVNMSSMGADNYGRGGASGWNGANQTGDAGAVGGLGGGFGAPGQRGQNSPGDLTVNGYGAAGGAAGALVAGVIASGSRLIINRHGNGVYKP
jgi:hypothetical protein